MERPEKIALIAVLIPSGQLQVIIVLKVKLGSKGQKLSKNSYKILVLGLLK